MAYTYSANVFDLDGEVWTSPTSGGPGGASGPIINDGVIANVFESLVLFGAPYNLTNNGHIVSTAAVGIYLPNNFGPGVVSTLVNSASGMISGYLFGLFSAQAVNLTNNGTITGGEAVHIIGNGSPITITNTVSGHIEADSFAIFVDSGLSTKIVNKGTIVVNSVQTAIVMYSSGGVFSVDNSGQIFGGIFCDGPASGTLKNSGYIQGDVVLDDGQDKFTNTGFVSGLIALGNGDDVFSGGKFRDLVVDQQGSDNYKLGDGIDEFNAVAFGSDLGTDKVDGGANAGTNIASGTYGDIYEASAATSAVIINLDGKTHVTTGALKSQASGAEVGIDLIKGFENADGGSGHDIIVGNAAANLLNGNFGDDKLFGGSGNDEIYGSAGGDWLTGDAGSDKLWGDNDGAIDRFRYGILSDSTVGRPGRDAIYGFEDGFDRIDFTDLAIASHSSNILVDADFTGAVDVAEVRLLSTLYGWLLQLDMNGDKKADLAIDIHDPGHSGISWDATDFYFPS